MRIAATFATTPSFIMWTGYNGIFAVGCLGMVVLSVVWFLLERRSGRRAWKCGGALSTAVAAVIVAGTRWADSLPWIWMIPQFTMLLWLATFVLMAIGVVTACCLKGSDRRPLLIVSLVSLALNGCSFLAFLWMATVSAGGV